MTQMANGVLKRGKARRLVFVMAVRWPARIVKEEAP
jgi:hypothetical protein